MITWLVVALRWQRWSYKVGVHWLRTILSHLFLWWHVGRRGSLCNKKYTYYREVSFHGLVWNTWKSPPILPGIWNGLPGSELDGEWGKVTLLPLPGEFGKPFPDECGKGTVFVWVKDSGKVAFWGMCGSFCCRGLRNRGSIVCLALNSLFLGTKTGGNTDGKIGKG